MTPILLDSPLWFLLFSFVFFTPVGVASLVAALLTGGLCGRCMTNLTIRAGLIIGGLTVPAVLLATSGWLYLYDWGIEWASVLIMVVATLCVSFLWNLLTMIRKNAS